MHPDEPTRSTGPAPADVTTGGLSGWLGVTADAEPDRVAGYHIQGKLGQGGMGVVFKAHHPELKRPAAVKRLLSGAHAPERERVRFLAEAEAMAAVRHPHVVTVYDFGTEFGQPYLAMEYLDGGSLHTKLEEAGRLPPDVAADLVAKVAAGVQAAHDQGIVHRDLKPGNVLLDAAGEPKVTDFGLAKRGDGDTASHAVMGTVGYMAPEQARGQTKRAGPAADVYALGAVLFRCLAGRTPFEGGDLAEVLLRVIDEEAPSVSSVTAGIPRDLALIVAKCLEKDPARRYPTAAALAADLTRFRAGEPVAARPVGAAERAVKWARRRPYLAGLSVALVDSLLIGTLTSTALAVWALREKGQAERARQIAAERAQEAEAEATRATQVADALAGVFGSSDPLDIFTDGLAPPAWEQQRTKTAERMLRDAAAGFRTALRDQPLARGRLLGTAGVSFRNQGLLADAAPLLEESLALRRRALPADSPEVAAAEVELGRVRLEEGDGPAALPLFRAAVGRLERAGGPPDAVAHARLFEGWALSQLGRSEAVDVLDRVIAYRDGQTGPAGRHALMARLAKVAVLMDLGRGKEAVALVPDIQTGLAAVPPGQVRDITRTLFDGQVAIGLANAAGDSPLALRLAADGLAATVTAMAGPLPPRTIYHALVRYHQADVAFRRGDRTACDAFLDACLDDIRATCGLAHAKALLVVRGRADRYADGGDPAAADRLYSEAAVACQARYGPASNAEALLLFDRAEFEARRGRWADAVATAERALALADKVVPTRQAWREPFGAAADLRDGPPELCRETTFRLLAVARRLAAEAGGPNGEGVALTTRDEAEALRKAGRHREAAATLAAAQSLLDRRPDAPPVDRNVLLVYRGRLERDRGDFAAAADTYAEAAKLSKGLTGKHAGYHADDLRDRAGALADQGELVEAKKELGRALAAVKKEGPKADIRRRLSAVRAALGEPVGDVRSCRAALAGVAATVVQKPADPAAPHFGTDWLDRLPWGR